ncbi:hypothetical protein SAMN05444266_103485 [Chitinophaga jiangningensis]|uniref:Uncharacterized protein n=1 Tax=Chitinophaga jiangningensis TaxID=1419482 RepID=A0A1M7B0Y3_9BACT|nr:hypothetical protein SAMN05444266_103485 [Chitinophaga jiangningensis]
MLGIEFLVLIPFLLKYRQLDPSSKWIFYYILLSLLFSAGSYLIMVLYKNNMWYFNLMHFLQFVVLSMFYISCIKSPKLRYIILRLPIVMLFVFSVDFFRIDGMKFYNSVSTGLKAALMIFYAISLFMQQLSDKELIEKSIYINSLPTFWYNSGLFLYFCSTILFSISLSLFQKTQHENPDKMVLVTYSITYAIGSISMILFYIGLSKTKLLKYADH